MMTQIAMQIALTRYLVGRGGRGGRNVRCVSDWAVSSPSISTAEAPGRTTLVTPGSVA
jgi:hypothetical protein